MKNIDYPAGHSMDSEWFAVDKDGNVGFFDTGQNGMVPIIHGREYYISEYIRDNAKVISKNFNEFFLYEEKVNEIIKKCNKRVINKLLSDLKKDNWFYFEGFFILKKGCKIEDLNLLKIVEKSDEDYILSISPENNLFYISSFYKLQKYFIDALKKGFIIKAFKVDLMMPDNDYGDDIGDLRILGGFLYENDWGNKPYKRMHIPDIPLKIDIFSEKAKKNALKFDVLFYDMPYIQPIEFTSCELYTEGDCNVIKKDSNNFIKVTLSDNETQAYCRMSFKHRLNIYNCYRCGKRLNEYDIKSFSDYPTVFIFDYIATYYNYYYNDNYNINYLIDFLNLNNIEIRKENMYFTGIVKCFNNQNKTIKQDLNDRFQKCYSKLIDEVEMLLPSLIICAGKINFELLKSKFEIDVKQFKTYQLCNIKINNIAIPMLMISSLKTKILTNEKLKSISEQINAIIKAERNLPILPRIL